MVRVAVPLLFLIAACGGGSTGQPAVEDPDERLELGDRPSDRRGGAHPEDDDEDLDENLAVEGLRGRMDTYDIQRAIEPHAGDIDACFQQNTRRKGYLGGKVVLEFFITAAGELERVHIKESDLGAWAIERCLLEVAGQMQFSRPKGGKADFTVPLEWGATRPVTWWTEEQAELALEDLPAELEACAEAAGGDVRNVWVTVYVGARGEVQSVGFASPARQRDPAIWQAWAECATTTIGAWTLPDPRGTITKLGFRHNPE